MKQFDYIREENKEPFKPLDLEENKSRFEFNYGMCKTFGFGIMVYFNWESMKSFHFSTTFLFWDFDMAVDITRKKKRVLN